MDSRALMRARKLQRAAEELKAKAAAGRGTSHSKPPRVPVEPAVPRTRLASELPEDFFDARPGASSDTPESGRPSAKLKSTYQRVDAKPSPQASTQHSKETPTAMGALPKGFFDNSDADSRARGIEPEKISIQDEYEQFRKSINEDVKGVDVRLEEEEFEAAEDREEFEQLEQRNLLDRIEAIKKRQRQKAEAAAHLKKIDQPDLDEDEEDDSTDESDDDKLFVDWRAKHL
ncbi:unnamed protein product [Calypogeia fissa]